MHRAGGEKYMNAMQSRECIFNSIICTWLRGEGGGFLFLRATFHIPLPKSVTLNTLLHCSPWEFSGALFAFPGLFYAFRGWNHQDALGIFFPPAVVPYTTFCVKEFTAGIPFY